MRTGTVAAAVFLVIGLWAGPVAARSVDVGWSLTGGESWEERTGPGLMLGVGGNDCTDNYCSELWDTRFLGSFGGFVGFFYRLIPNLSFFADFHLGYIRTTPSWADDDRGVLVQITAGGAFHAPITGWLDAHLGLGVGFAHLGMHGTLADDGRDAGGKLSGFNIEARFGADVYLFSAAPTLGLGPYFKLGFPIWARQCVKRIDGARAIDECESPGDFDDPRLRKADLPFLVHFGIAARYGF